ncbi:MAG: TIGR03067 domain-containing protein [Gemmataceae bacterium]|nr:TIGR03067 domain-containing protein [Gemmataceae bacterium]
MRLLTLATVLVFAALAPAGADDKDKKDGPKEAAKKLEGTYEVLEVLVDGKPDKKKDEVTAFEIKGDELVVKTPDRDESATFTLDPSKKPAHIDITPKKGGPKTVPGIYEVKETDKGLELTIAFGRDEAGRPKDFKGEGKDEVVIKLFRKKAK